MNIYQGRLLYISALLACLCKGAWCDPAPSPQLSIAPAFQDVRCNADISFRYVEAGLEGSDVLKPASEVNTRFEYAIKSPSKVKVTLKSYTAPDLPSIDVFDGRVGMSVVLSERKLTIALPNGNTSTVNLDEKTDRQNLVLPHGNLNIPFAGSFVADALSIKNTDWTKSKQIGVKKLDGKTLPVLEVRFPKPVSTMEPLSISAIRRIIDPTLHTVVEEEARDEQDKIVSKTTFRSFQKNSEGVWFALTSTTVIPPRRTTLAFPAGDSTNGTPPFWKGRLLLKGRTINRNYILLNNKYPLLDSIEVTDDEGNSVMKGRFTNYRINENIPDSVFETTNPAAQ